LLSLLLALNVLCIGDSNTEFGPSYCDISIHDTTNIGQSATTTQTWARRTLYDTYTSGVEIETFDVVSFLLGGNDTNIDRDPAIVASNLNTTIEWLIDDGAQRIAIALPAHWADSGFWSPEELALKNDLLDAYALEFQAIADARPGVYISTDWRELGLLYPDHYTDFVHYNATGHTIAAESVDIDLALIGELPVVPVPEPSQSLLIVVGVLTLALMKRHGHTSVVTVNEALLVFVHTNESPNPPTSSCLSITPTDVV
jgi:lysophospholipase L1-like esterase